MSSQLTIRKVPKELARRLKELAERRGQSVNETVLTLLRDSVGLDERVERLKKYATWTREEVAEMDGFIREQRAIDDDLWK